MKQKLLVREEMAENAIGRLVYGGLGGQFRYHKNILCVLVDFQPNSHSSKVKILKKAKCLCLYIFA